MPGEPFLNLRKGEILCMFFPASIFHRANVLISIQKLWTSATRLLLGYSVFSMDVVWILLIYPDLFMNPLLRRPWSNRILYSGMRLPLSVV
jgi:hypothetical protein